MICGGAAWSEARVPVRVVVLVFVLVIVLVPVLVLDSKRIDLAPDLVQTGYMGDEPDRAHG
jgi:hypothetical protein